MSEARRSNNNSRGPARRRNSGRRGASGDSSSRGPAPKPLAPSDTPPQIESFSEFALDEETQAAIRDMGIVKPTPIQALTIGPVLERRDVIAKAETGTGKTLAFGAPMMSMIDPARASVLGLVLSPTRELAEQVYSVLAKLGEARGVKVALIVGGEPLGPQVRALQGGAQVVVATPGRVIDLMGQGFLSFPWTEFAVLDEADKMLEIGFIDDVRKILEASDPDVRQTLLFSATFPPALLDLARAHTRNPLEVATAAGVSTVTTIRQTFLRVTEESRPRALVQVIEDSKPDDVLLVFCDRRTDVDQLLRRLERLRFSVKALHGGYDQAARFRVMDAFRTGEVKALIATDVASRGLDVEHVTHVINYGVPRDVSDYTHRIGRTGRAGRTGTSLTFVSERDEGRWKLLTRNAPWTIEELSRPSELRADHVRPRAVARAPETAPRGRSERSDRPERPKPESEARSSEVRGGRERGTQRRDSEPRERVRTSEREREPELASRAREESRPARPARSEREPESSGEERPRRERSTRSRRGRAEREEAGAAPERTPERAPAAPERARAETEEAPRQRRERSEPREPAAFGAEPPRRQRSGRERPERDRSERSDARREEPRQVATEERAPRPAARRESAHQEPQPRSEAPVRSEAPTRSEAPARREAPRSQEPAPPSARGERHETRAEADARRERSRQPAEQPKKAAPARAGGSFGAGLAPEPERARQEAAPKQEREPRARDRAPEPTENEAPSRKAKGPSGFGAGL